MPVVPKAKVFVIFIACLFCSKYNFAQAPVISNFTPSAACPGSNIIISGANFTGATAVKIGGSNVISFDVVSDNSINAILGKGTTGVITVSTPNGIATSNAKFSFGTSSNAFAYIPNYNSRTVSVINTVTDALVTTIDVVVNPFSVAASPDGSKVYVASSFGNGSISVISTVSNTVIATINIGVSLEGIVVSPDGSKLFVATYSGLIMVINTATNLITSTISLTGSFSLAVSPDGNKLYVSYNSKTITVINTNNNAVISNIPISVVAYTMTISPDGNNLYITGYASQYVSIVNTVTRVEQSVITVGNAPACIAVSNDGSKMYVSNGGSNTVSVFNSATNSLITTILVGQAPFGLALTPDGNKLYVSNSQSNTVSIINTTTNKVIGTTSVGLTPQAIGNFIANITSSCPPSISSFSPTTACQSNTIAIKGSGFLNATSVKFGGADAVSFTVDSDTSITALSGAGSGQVSVTTAVGTGLSNGSFTLLTGCPVINTFPAVFCSGSSIFIDGKNLTGTTAVTFGGIKAASFRVVTASRITATMSQNSPSTGVVTVTTAAGSTTGKNPYATGALSAPYAYVPKYNTNAINVINTTNNNVIAAIPVGVNPYGVAVAANGRYVYVTNASSNSVSVISTAANAVIATLAAGSNPHGIAVSPDGGLVYVANILTNSVTVINTASNAVLATVTVGSNPEGIIVSPDGSKIFVTNYGSNTVSVISKATNTVTATVNVGGNPKGIAVSADGGFVYVANYTGNTVSVINTASNIVAATIPVGSGPSGLVVNPGAGRLYVANYLSSAVSVIDVNTNAVSATIPVGNPYNPSVTPDGSQVYVTNYSSGGISVINVFNNTVTATLPIICSQNFLGSFIASVLIPCPPVVASFAPASACTDSTVTIKGINFDNASSVKFGGVEAKSFTVNSTGSISAVLGKGNTGVITITTPGGAAASSLPFTAGGVPAFSVTPNPFYLCGGTPRLLTTGLTGAYQLSVNGQPALSIKAPGTYTVTAKDQAGCTNSAIFTAYNYANCNGYIEVIVDSVVNYFDTVHVRVNMRNGVNIFSTFAYLNFDYGYRLLDSHAGTYLGANIINTPPVVTGNVVDFGMTKTPGQAGSNGDGVIYDFRFLRNLLPNIAFDSLNPNTYLTGFRLSNLNIYNTAGIKPASFTDISLFKDSTALRYYVPVWPGDLNNDKIVDVSDILPIGYFYMATGPVRPNASLAWKAQPAPLWAFDKTNTNSPAYETFADANADGVINLADQAPIGFNLNSAHSFRATFYKAPVFNFSKKLPALHVKLADTAISPSSLPKNEVVSILAGTKALPVNNLYGVAFDVFFDPAFVNISEIKTNYSASIFGKEGVDFTKIEDRSALAEGRLSIGITRYNTTAVTGAGGLVVKINLPMVAKAPNGKFRVIANPIASNDRAGIKLNITGSVDSLAVGSSWVITANADPNFQQTGRANTLPVFDGLIYPNPASNTANLVVSGAKGKVRVTVTDLTGRSIYQLTLAGNSNNNLPINNLAAGTYMVTISDGNKNKTLKLVIAR